MKSTVSQKSELNPPENITPSFQTVMSGILVLLPLVVVLLGLYMNAINS